MNPTDTVTIAITAYNSGAGIDAALQSAARQDWPDLEILVYDDASTDDTQARVLAASASLPTLRLLTGTENRGVAHARNQLIQAASGTYLVFFDDDDVSAPERVRCQVERLRHIETQTGSDCVICHTARTQQFPNGYQRYEATMGTEDDTIPHGQAVAERILFGRLSPGVVGSVATCSQLGRTELYRRMDGFDTNLTRSEDTDFAIRLGLAGGYFAGIAAPLVTQTMTPGSEKRLSAELENYARIVEKHRDYLKAGGWYRFCRQWLAARAALFRGERMRLFGILAGLALRHPIKLCRKLRWAMPARHTRKDFQRWHRGQMGSMIEAQQ